MQYIVLVLMMLIGIGPVGAESIYKCKDAAGNIAFANIGCRANATQIPTDVRSTRSIPSSNNAAQGSGEANVGSESTYTRQLDSLVKGAIVSGDMRHTRDLALTAKHWEWIAEAQKNAQSQPVTGRTVADLRAEKSGTQECQHAKRSLDIESSSPEAIDTKRRLMYEACGMEVPAEVNVENSRTVIDNRRVIINRSNVPAGVSVRQPYPLENTGAWRNAK